MVPLAWAARAAGHEIRIAGTPSISGAIVHTGLPAVVVGHDVPAVSHASKNIITRFYKHCRFPADWPLNADALDDEQRALLSHLAHNSAEAAEAMVDDLIRFTEDWRPDLIVHDAANFAGAVAAAATGLPDVRHLTGVGLRPLESPIPGAGALPEYTRLFDRFGVPPRVPPTLTVDPSPPSLRLPVDGVCLEQQYVPYNGHGEQPRWLLTPRSRPRVCVTWGHSVLRAAAAVGRSAMSPFLDAITAVAALDVEVVLATTARHVELLGELPTGVRIAESAPLQLVLPYCDLIIHQAGDGTALTAAALGLPQLAITSKPDPALTAERLTAFGAAEHLRYQELGHGPPGTELIRGMAEKILADSAYAVAAGRLRQEILRQPTPAETVKSIAALIGAS